MKMFWIILFLLYAATAPALETAALVDGAAAELLKKNCIRTDVGGVLPVPFSAAAELLSQPDLILYIQQEYPSSISADGHGAYHYFNEKNQRTEVFELYRKQTSESSFDLVYLAKGKRFFGKYDVLIHIRAVDVKAAGTLYIAEIHAYPRNGALRFFARRFGKVERYFQRKTHLIASASNRICIDLEKTPDFTYQPTP